MNAIDLARHDMRRLSTSLPGADGDLKQGELARVEIVHPDGTYVVSVLRRLKCEDCGGLRGWEYAIGGNGCESCHGTGRSLQKVNITVDAEQFRKATGPQREREAFWESEA